MGIDQNGFEPGKVIIYIRFLHCRNPHSPLRSLWTNRKLLWTLRSIEALWKCSGWLNRWCILIGDERQTAQILALLVDTSSYIDALYCTIETVHLCQVHLLSTRSTSWHCKMEERVEFWMWYYWLVDTEATTSTIQLCSGTLPRDWRFLMKYCLEPM